MRSVTNPFRPRDAASKRFVQRSSSARSHSDAQPSRPTALFYPQPANNNPSGYPARRKHTQTNKESMSDPPSRSRGDNPANPPVSNGSFGDSDATISSPASIDELAAEPKETTSTGRQKKTTMSILRPYRLQLSRKGEGTLFFRTPVNGTQTFLLELPFVGLTLAVNTFRVQDDRKDACPVVSFPAPQNARGTAPKDAALWHALLHANIGAKVELDTLHGPRTGHVLGLDVGDELATILLDEDGRVGVHAFDPSYPTPMHVHTSPSSVSKTAPRAVPRTSAFVYVTAHGEGEGVISMAYCINSPHDPAFDIIYHLSVPKAAEPALPNTVSRLCCSVRIPNPVQFDLNGIEVQLSDIEYRPGPTEVAHMYDEESASHLRKKAIKSSNSPPDNYSQNQSHNSDSSSSSSDNFSTSNAKEKGKKAYRLDFDEISSATRSEPSNGVEDLLRHTLLNVPNVINLPVGRSVETKLFETQVEVSLIHWYLWNEQDRNTIHLSLQILNTSSHLLESGTGIVEFDNGQQYDFWMIPLPPQKISLSMLVTTSSISLRAEGSLKANEKKKSCLMIDGILRIRYWVDRTIQFHICNKDIHSCVAGLSYDSELSAYNDFGNEEAYLYNTAEDVAKGVMKRAVDITRNDKHPRRMLYVPLKPGEKCVVVVREQSQREKRLNMQDLCTPYNMFTLRNLELIDTETMEKLNKAIENRRSIRALQRQQASFSKRRRWLKAQQMNSPSDDWQLSIQGAEESVPLAERLDKFLAINAATQDCVTKLQKEEISVVDSLVIAEAKEKQIFREISERFNS